MGYGITSTSQIIDLNAIQTGCEQFKQALLDFEKSGETVIQAGEACTKKALSIDEATLEFSITDLGNEMKDLKTTFTNYADQVMADATNVYNAQVTEYNEYITSLQQNNN